MRALICRNQVCILNILHVTFSLDVKKKMLKWQMMHWRFLLKLPWKPVYAMLYTWLRQQI